MRAIKVLCVADHYLPGFKAGGPIRTIENMVKQLSDEIKFHIFTRNHDIGESEKYSTVPTNLWTEEFDASIYYASTDDFSLAGLKRAIAYISPDVVYLNSFFSPRAGITPAIMMTLSRSRIPCLIAPRGEFSPGALALKPGKKSAYLKISRLLGIYRNTYWQASSQQEKGDIQQALNIEGSRIYVAPDLVSQTKLAPQPGIAQQTGEGAHPLAIAFISRISPKKNLIFLLETLKQIKYEIKLSIYGPVEDQTYWEKCQAIINDLPRNIVTNYCGAISPEEVGAAFSQADIFAFPTLGENFGHVIFESISVGTAVMVSDQTPWQDDGTQVMTNIPLDNRQGWISAISAWAEMIPAARIAHRSIVLKYVQKYLQDSPAKTDNLRMFQEIVTAARR